MIQKLSVGSLSAALQSGGRSAVDIAADAIAAGDRLNPSLRCFITIASEEALERAEAADARRRTGNSIGLLDGIPYAAKDMFETRGILTTGGSKVLHDNVPHRSAVAIDRLDEAGAVLIGKANLHEFAYGATGENAWSGTTVNPYDQGRLAGGSSGGSAAAVAAGIVPFALGTDTGGSVRVPAALCGVVGFKPSFGLISLEGVIPYCWSLDHAGVIASSVADVALVTKQILDLVPNGAPETLRIGVVPGWDEICSPDVRATFLTARATLEEAGAGFVEIALPDQAEARTVSLTIQLAEALAYHGPNLTRARSDFGEDMLSGMVLGQFLSAESYVQCKRMLTVYNRRFAQTMADVDVLLTPACPIVAPEIGTVHVDVGDRQLPIGNALTLFTSFFNLVGAPAVVVPVSRQSAVLPVAVQLVGARNDDARLLAIAEMLERALSERTSLAA